MGNKAMCRAIRAGGFQTKGKASVTHCDLARSIRRANEVFVYCTKIAAFMEAVLEMVQGTDPLKRHGGQTQERVKGV